MIEYCNCKDIKGIHTDYEDSFGYWEVCDSCNKRIEDGHHYYDHYDGADHDDGDIS